MAIVTPLRTKTLGEFIGRLACRRRSFPATGVAHDRCEPNENDLPCTHGRSLYFRGDEGNRTPGEGFADPCLATWRRRRRKCLYRAIIRESLRFVNLVREHLAAKAWFSGMIDVKVASVPYVVRRIDFRAHQDDGLITPGLIESAIG